VCYSTKYWIQNKAEPMVHGDESDSFVLQLHVNRDGIAHDRCTHASLHPYIFKMIILPKIPRLYENTSSLLYIRLFQQYGLFRPIPHVKFHSTLCEWIAMTDAT
jgi:hypothetical protein